MKRFLTPSLSHTTALFVQTTRTIASYGRITDEDRRWWKIHLESHPDVTLGTFVSFLDSCGTHTTKRLIERNVWTVEQVSQLTEDEVEVLRYKDGCIHMDVVWEHARSIAPELRKRETGGGTTTDDLQLKVLELRKKRELERRKQEILANRAQEVESRQERITLMKDEIAKKKEELRRKQAEREKAKAGGGGLGAGTMRLGEAMTKAASSSENSGEGEKK
eukprot:PhF_6_TR4162/c0_g1_i1/m.5590